MKKILFALIALVFFAPCADAQLPKVGRMNKLVVDTLYSARIDSLLGGVRTQEGRIDVLYNEVDIRVVDSVFDALEGVVSTHSGQINIFDSLITSKVSQTDYDTNGDTLRTWGTDIRQTLDGITLSVNGIKDSSWIALTAEKIAMHADTIALEGYVTAERINSMFITADSVNTDWLNSNIVVADSVIANWINANTISADRISGDTLSGVVINGVEIWGANIIGSNYYSTPTNGMFADGNLVAIDGETINFMSRTWSEAFGGGYELNSLATITASDVENWNGKANAFSGYTGTLTVRMDDDSALRLHFTNGVLTGTSTP